MRHKRHHNLGKNNSVGVFLIGGKRIFFILSTAKYLYSTRHLEYL